MDFTAQLTHCHHRKLRYHLLVHMLLQPRKLYPYIYILFLSYKFFLKKGEIWKSHLNGTCQFLTKLTLLVKIKVEFKQFTYLLYNYNKNNPIQNSTLYNKILKILLEHSERFFFYYLFFLTFSSKFFSFHLHIR